VTHKVLGNYLLKQALNSLVIPKQNVQIDMIDKLLIYSLKYNGEFDVHTHFESNIHLCRYVLKIDSDEINRVNKIVGVTA